MVVVPPPPLSQDLPCAFLFAAIVLTAVAKQLGLGRTGPDWPVVTARQARQALLAMDEQALPVEVLLKVSPSLSRALGVGTVHCRWWSHRRDYGS